MKIAQRRVRAAICEIYEEITTRLKRDPRVTNTRG